MLIEASQPLTVRRSCGELRLLPGSPVDLPEEEARKLLAKACGKVRAPIIVERAMQPDGRPLPPVYWDRHGEIIGPAQPEFFFRDSTGQVGLIIRYEGNLVSVADSMLRSRKECIKQRPLKEVQLIQF